MPKPKVHATTQERVKSATAAYRSRLKALSPVERYARAIGEPVPYTEDEMETLDVLKSLISEVERVSLALNESLRGRAEIANSFTAVLEKDTRIQIRTY